MIVASGEAVAKHNLTPLVRIAGYGISGTYKYYLLTTYLPIHLYVYIQIYKI